MIRTTGVLLVLTLAVQSPARQGDDGAPLDPAHAVAQFRKAYHRRAFVESIEVYVTTPSQRRRETVIVRGNIRGEVAIDLGDLSLWTDGPKLLAVHRLNARLYFDAPLEGTDRAASVVAQVPPLPVPQLALALQSPDAPASSWIVSPICRPLRWDGASAFTRAGRPCVELSATGESCAAAVVGAGDPPRLREVRSELHRDDGVTTMRADITRLDEPVGRFGADLRGRTRVAALSELVPIPGDLRPGLAMPEMLAEPLRRRADRTPRIPSAGKPSVIIIVTDASPAVESSARACRDTAGTSAILIGVAPLADSEPRRNMRAMLERLDAQGAAISYSARSTIDRLAPGRPGAAAVVDSTGLIVRILELPDPRAAESVREALDSIRP